MVIWWASPTAGAATPVLAIFIRILALLNRTCNSAILADIRYNGEISSQENNRGGLRIWNARVFDLLAWGGEAASREGAW